MYSKYEVKCKDCGDIITLIYDSREKTQQSVTCKCGKLRASPDCYSYSYHREGNPERLSYTMSNLKEDYFVLDEEIQSKYDQVKELAETLGFEETKCEDDINGEGLICYLWLYYDTIVGCENESVEIELKLDLHKYDGWSEYEIDKFKETIIKRLDEFYKFLLKAKENPEILSDEKYLWETNDFDIQGDREQHNSYDYEFWF